MNGTSRTSEAGQGLVEYAILMVLVAVGCVLADKMLINSLSSSFQRITGFLSLPIP